MIAPLQPMPPHSGGRHDARDAPASVTYMACRQARCAGEHGTTAGMDAARDGGDAELVVRGFAGRAHDARGSAQVAIEAPQQGGAPAETQGVAASSAAALAPRGLYARPELDDDLVGTYMADAIERGGYREALEHYASDEAKKSETPWHRLRARGWLLGRLGLYDQVGGWLEEASTLPDFGHLSTADIFGRRTPYRTPPLWMQMPEPAQRNTGHLLTVESAAAPCHDASAVPSYIWTAMLILEAAGPICSHTGFGAAAFLAGAGAERPPPAMARGDRRYDPLRGARLHGAPKGCHRWIIADINFDPRPVNGPHYYYDLTDEGRRALGAARAAGAPWSRDVEAAASGLGDMSLPDLLEGACCLHGPLRDLCKMRGELSRVHRAWLGQERGSRDALVAREDQALVDLGPASKWCDAGDGTASALDHTLYLMTVVRSVWTMACEAEPRSAAEGAVLRTLVGTIQGLCRRRGRAVATAASFAGRPASPAPGGSSGTERHAPRRPPPADAPPALISDLYYCLAEYCRSRRLAVDPCSLPPSERLTDDDRAAVIDALTKDNPFYDDTGQSHRGR